jgi:hypothetical protein
MWPVCGHYGHFPAFHVDTVAINSYNRFTVDNIYQGVKWCRMLTQALSLFKSEEVTVPVLRSIIVRLTTELLW